MHAREQIIDAFASALSITTFKHRVYELPRNHATCALITWSDEGVNEQFVIGAPCEYSRALNVTVSVHAKGMASVDLATGAAETVETELAALSIGDRVTLTSASLASDDEGEQPVTVVTLSYSVTYRTQSDTPDTIL